jgi:asparagine synthase (glutamine-hydrolysing)
VSRFVALRWPVDDPAAADHQATAIGTVLRSARWICQVERPGWQLWCEHRAGRWMLHTLEEDQVIVIGRLFDRRATESGSVADAVLPDRCASFGTLCRWLTDATWGAYAALRCDPDRPELIELFRDPVGQTECTTWVSEGVRIVASHPETIISDAPPARFGIDWPGLGELLRRPILVSDQIALDGIDVVPPGTVVRIDDGHRTDRCLWSPAAFASRLITPDRRGIRPELADACTAAWTSCSQRAVAELSGGLDSAIVAAGAVAQTRSPVRAWFNYYAIDPRGDERRFAQAIADRLNLPLEMIFCPEVGMKRADVDTMPIGMRPGFGSTNFIHDADLARRGGDMGADMLLTGNGGDALFFQDPSPWIATDLHRDGRRFRDKLALLLRLSRWTGDNVWSLATRATGLRQAPLDLPETGCSFLSDRRAPTPDPIPWLIGTDALPPAKRLHILYLAITRSSFNPSWCAQAMSVVHPLMSQPLLEHVLPIPTIALTDARRDRALARAAYADRLPSLVIDRQGKGVLTPHYGRRLAASTDFLRDYLLGGVLVAQHVIEPARLEPILDPEHLMHSDHYAELLLAVMAERWARVWSDRCRPGSSRIPMRLAGA